MRQATSATGRDENAEVLLVARHRSYLAHLCCLDHSPAPQKIQRASPSHGDWPLRTDEFLPDELDLERFSPPNSYSSQSSTEQHQRRWFWSAHGL